MQPRRRLAIVNTMLLCIGLMACGAAPSARPAASSAAAPVAAPAQAADSAEWEQILAAARREGKVVVAGPPQPAEREVLMRFRQAYPDITLEYSGILAQDLAARMEAERAAGSYLWDLAIGGVSTQYAYIPRGFYQPFRPVLVLPEVRDESNWLGGIDGGFSDLGKTYIWSFTSYITNLLKVNRSAVPESELSGAAGLVDPRWKGKIVVYDPRAGGAGLLAVTALRQEFGDEFIRKLLVDQQPVFSTDKRQFTEWVVRARYSIGVGVVDAYLAPFWEEGLGKDVQTLESKIKVLTQGSGGISFIDRAPHPNATKVFVNWLLSRQTQEVWAREAATNSRRLDVPPGSPDALPDPTQLANYVDFNSEAGNPFMRDTQRLAQSVLE